MSAFSIFANNVCPVCVSIRWGIGILAVVVRRRPRAHEGKGDEGADSQEYGLDHHGGIGVVQDRGQDDRGEEEGSYDVGFFDNDTFFSFRDKACAIGIKQPIIAGIMP